jgi:bilirubin oxidase
MNFFLYKTFSRSFIASFTIVLIGLFLPFCAKSQFTTKLLIPDTISTANNDVIHLNMVKSQKVFFPGATKPVRPGDAALFKGDTLPVPTLCYSLMPTAKSGYLGPTLIWWKGDSVTMEVENRMGVHSTTHWHGAHVAPQNDGGPHQVIEAGETWKPSFRIRDNAATMWYHPHLHEHTMEHVAKGLAGFIIVKDAADPFRKVLPNRYGIDDLPIVIQDKYFIHDTMTQANDINTTCEMGTNFFVNGVWQPYVDVPAQPVRLRILNGSAERTYCIFLRDSTAKEWVPFKVIASDAGYLETPHTMGTSPTKKGDLGQLLIMMSGERYEIVFDGTGRENHQLYLMNMRNLMTGSRQVESFAGGPGPDGPPCYKNLATNPDSTKGLYPYPDFDSTPLALMQINIKAADGKAGSVPATFAPYAYKPITAAVNKERKKTLWFDLNFQPPFSIDSIGFKDEVINDTIILGHIERWKFKNLSFTSHPLHLHDVHFFVESMTDWTTGNPVPIPVPMYMRGAKDVVAIPDSTEVTFIAQFEDFATPIKPENCYMYHCHILGHEDGGMMHQFVVTAPNLGVGIKEEQQLAKWNVYPNPTTNTIFVEMPENTSGSLKLFDLMGRKIQEWQTNETTLQLDVSKVANGVYMLQWDNAGVISSRRISILK